jgi:uncharacterized OB-fold protein
MNNTSTESRSSAPHLTLYRCGGSHFFFFPHEICPVCGAKLEGFESSPDGVLVSHTTVWVSPTGAPFNLGLARVACGAQTLCIVDGELGADPGEKIVVFVKGGICHARSR